MESEAASVISPPERIQSGNYILVGWDIDPTGRRLIDDICQVAGYTPSSQFSQYIMPNSNINPWARQRHHIRIVTIGRYRLLKDNHTNKVLKTKSEVTALTQFLDWLEKQKAASDGVILIHHEGRRMASLMLLEALQRYNLLSRFKDTVVGFADGQAMATTKCQTSVKSFSLKVLASVLLDIQLELRDASERASAAYQIAKHLCQGEEQELTLDEEDANRHMMEIIRQFTFTVDNESNELAKLKVVLNRQNTFRPVFAPLLNYTTRDERIHASNLRKILVEANYDYKMLKDIWDSGKLEGLTKELQSLNSNVKEELIKEILEILNCHFDPEKQPKEVVVARFARNKGGNRNKKPNPGNQLNENLESGTVTPDTTSSGTPVKEKTSPKEADTNGHSEVTEVAN